MSMNCVCGAVRNCRETVLAVRSTGTDINEGSCELKVVDIVGVERQFDQQQRTVSSVW